MRLVKAVICLVICLITVALFWLVLKQESKTAVVLVVLCCYVCIQPVALVLLLFLVKVRNTLKHFT